MAFRVEQLRISDHGTDDFDCGAPFQNKFLKEYAWDNYQTGHSITFVAVEEGGDGTVCGYYTLSAGSVEFEHAPPEYKKRKGLPKYPIPTALIGQFAVDEAYQGGDLGEALLINAIARSVEVSEDVGIAAVEIHAENEELCSYYERFGFVRMQDSDEHLFLSKDVAESIAEDVEVELASANQPAT